MALSTANHTYETDGAPRRWTRIRLDDLRRQTMFWLRARQRRQLRRRTRSCQDFPELFALATEIFVPGPAQTESEIAAFVQLAAQQQPQVLCEIGTQDGGNLFLLGGHLSTLSLMIGIDPHVKNQTVLRALIDPRRNLNVFEGSSYAAGTYNAVATELGDRRIDVLFIDGDHSYGGAARDYLLYRDLVRSGGLIAFHDIVPDRHGEIVDGVVSDAYAGEVPRLWAELKPFFAHQEFIDDQGQLGRGIGVLHHDPHVDLPLAQSKLPAPSAP